MINDAKKSAAIDSAYGYISAIEYNNSMSNLNVNNNYTEISDGEQDVLNINNIINLKGTKPTSGIVELEKGLVISADLCINNYVISYDGKDMTLLKGSCNSMNDNIYKITLKIININENITMVSSRNGKDIIVNVTPKNDKIEYNYKCDGDTKISYENNKLYIKNITANDSCIIDFEKYEYLFNEKINKIILGTGSNYGNHSLKKSDGLLNYYSADTKNNGVSATTIISDSKVDFSKYDKIIVDFDSITINNKFWMGIYLNSSKYVGVASSKSNFSLELDVSDFNDVAEFKFLGTGRDNPTNNNWDSINSYTGSGTAIIKNIKLQYK